MQVTWFRHRLRRVREQPEGGYVAILTALMLTVLMSFVAFAVDVGRWYVVGQELQRTADAAALAGVTSLPNEPATAFATARQFAAANGYAGGTDTSVTNALGKAPTQLQTTVTTTVDNIFGGLLGVPRTTITRTAVADYAAPVPMGSPCNEFGNDPDPGSVPSSACTGMGGAFWADVNAPSSNKQYGDAFQAKVCGSGNRDGCNGSVNADYAEDGYFYTVHVTQPGSVTIQLFDPVWVNVGDTCERSGYFKNATTASNGFVSDAATRYAGGTGVYCTGDNIFSGGATPMKTQFTVRSPSNSPWDPGSFPPVGGTCTRTYDGYDGKLLDVLDSSKGTYKATIAQYFRRWTNLCTFTASAPGDYLVQVKTNGLGADDAMATNRFSMRAKSSAGNATVSVSGRQQMAIYSNKPSGVTQFYLARVDSSAAGKVLNVRLYDVGDSTMTGRIYILPPSEQGDAARFSSCTGSAPAPTSMGDCSFPVPTDTYNGKWVTISVPIPPDYRCNDGDAKSCWVRLSYDYGGGSAPTDTTTWQASIAGDPVRLIQ